MPKPKDGARLLQAGCYKLVRNRRAAVQNLTNTKYLRISAITLLEEIQVKEGKIQNASFTDYLLPTILDMPTVRAEILELADPEAPYGLKGVGEPPTIASTPAIVAALRDATGQKLPRVPVKPEQIVGIAERSIRRPPQPGSRGPVAPERST